MSLPLISLQWQSKVVFPFIPHFCSIFFYVELYLWWCVLKEEAKPQGSGDPVSDMFAEEFSDEMAKQFEDAMKNMVGDDPALVEQIEK